MNDTATPPGSNKVLLVGWDLASWDDLTPLLDGGHLPHLNALIERGVMGTLTTPGPLLAPIVFTSLATGMLADRHGVLGPYQVQPDLTVRPIDRHTRRAECFWETLSAQGRRCHVICYPTVSPAEDINGLFAAPGVFSRIPQTQAEPFHPGEDVTGLPDQNDVFEDLLIRVEEVPADALSLFVPYMAELSADDPDLKRVRRAIAQILSVHAVATWLIEQGDWDVLSVSYAALDALWRRFGAPPAGNPSEPRGPRSDLFRSVLPGSAKLIDMLIGRMVELCDASTAILVYSARSVLRARAEASGPTARALPPGPPFRRQGIFVMAAPTTRRDELIHDVNLLDLCPTVLDLAGVPSSADPDGKVLTDAFVERPPVPAARDRKPPPPTILDELCNPAPWTHRTFTGSFANRSARRIQFDAAWTLADALRAGPRRQHALPLMLQLYHANPLCPGKGVSLAEALYSAGYVSQAIDIMGPLAKMFPKSPTGQFMAGMLALHRGEVQDALEQFESAVRDDPPLPLLQFYLGQVCLRLDQRGRAMEAFRRCLDLDPGLIGAHLGLAEATYRAGQYTPSAEAALAALAVRFNDPHAHALLGRALRRLGEADRAAQAFETALRLAPDNALTQRLARQSGSDETDDDFLVVLPTPTNRPGRQAENDAVAQAQRDIVERHAHYVDALYTADGRLDAYLAANAGAQNRTAPAPPDSHDAADQAADPDHVVARPARVTDQPLLRQAFGDIFEYPHEVEAFVVAPDEADQRGVLALQTKDESGASLDLRLQVGARPGAGDDGEALARTRRRLLRTAIARAAAGGAKRLSCTVERTKDAASLATDLDTLGFEVSSNQTVWRMGMAEFRDRCLGLVDRYRQRKALPDNVRLLRLGRVPHDRVHRFLEQFFSDGAAAPASRLDPIISRVMLEDDTIIAAFVGHRKDPDTYVATRLGVLPEKRRLWVTPWLLGDGCREAYDLGRRTIEFYIDEARYPEFGKIARGMKAEQLDEITTRTLALAAPWT